MSDHGNLTEPRPRRRPARPPPRLLLDLRRLPPRPARRPPPAARRPRGRPGGALRRAPPGRGRGRGRGVGGRRRPALHPPLAEEHLDRREPLPARVVHDEAQPADQRGDRAARRLRRRPPVHPRAPLPGGARADGPPRGGPHRPHRVRARHAPALRRRQRRADRLPDDPRRPREGRRPEEVRPRPRLGPRHEPRHGALRRLRGEGARLHAAGDPRPRRAREEDDRRGRRRDDHGAEHARRLRGEHPRDHPDRPREGRLRLPRRGELQRLRREGPPGRHGRRRHAHEPAQDVLDAPRRRRPGRRPGRRRRRARAVPPGPDGRARRGRASASTSTAPTRSAGCGPSTATSASSSAR